MKIWELSKIRPVIGWCRRKYHERPPSRWQLSTDRRADAMAMCAEVMRVAEYPKKIYAARRWHKKLEKMKGHPNIATCEKYERDFADQMTGLRMVVLIAPILITLALVVGGLMQIYKNERDKTLVLEQEHLEKAITHNVNQEHYRQKMVAKVGKARGKAERARILRAIVMQRPEIDTNLAVQISKAVYIAKHQEGADPAMVLAIIEQESAFNLAARNPSGASGPMQVMTTVWRGKYGLHNDKDFHRVSAIIAGTKIWVNHYRNKYKSEEVALQKWNGWVKNKNSFPRDVLRTRDRIRGVWM